MLHHRRRSRRGDEPRDSGGIERAAAEADDAGPGEIGTGRVIGRVVDADGAAVAGHGVIVSPIDATTPAPARLRSDADGRFATGPLPAGRYAVAVPPADGFVAARGRRVDLGAGGVGDVGEMVVTPGATVTGTVVTPDGRPIGGARVAVLRSPLAPVITGGDGRFEFRGVRVRWGGRASFAAVADGRQRAQATATVAPSTTSSITIVLRAGHNLVLRVRSRVGDRAIPGAAVRVLPLGGPEPVDGYRAAPDPAAGGSRSTDGPAREQVGITDGAGTAEFAGLPDRELLVQVYADGFAAGAATVALPESTADEPAERTIRLDRPAAIVGSVVGPDGAPIDWPAPDADPSGFDAIYGGSVGDNDGLLAVTGASLAAAMPPSAGPVRLAAPAGVDDGRMRTIGAGLASVPIERLPGGRFRMGRVPPGRWIVVCVVPGAGSGWQPVEVDAGRTATVTVTLGRLFDAYAQVVDARTGEPIPGAEIRAESATAGRLRMNTARDGRMAIIGLASDDLRLTIDADGYLERTVAVAPSDTSEAEPLRIGLQPGGTIRGTIVTSTGAPMGSTLVVLVELGRAEPGQWVFNSRNDGTFTFRDLPPGRFRIGPASRHVWPDTPAEDRVIDIAPGETVTTTLTLSPAEWPGGRLIDALDRPVPDTAIELFVGHPRRPVVTGTTTTDGAGRFGFDPRVVPAGPHTVGVRVAVAGLDEPLTVRGVLEDGVLVYRLPDTAPGSRAALIVDVRNRETGRRPAGGRIDIEHLGTGRRRSAPLDPDAATRLDDLLPGRYRLSIGGDGIADTTLTVTAPAGQEQSVDVDAANGGRVTITATLPDGERASGRFRLRLTAVAVDPGIEHEVALTARNTQTATIERLRAGVRYAVAVRLHIIGADGGTTFAGAVTIGATAGSPIPGATVALQPAG
jgi:hypothetical protein